MPSIFHERDSRFSDFIKFNKRTDVELSVSADEAEEPEAEEEPVSTGPTVDAESKFPRLSYLRVELDRVRAGMGDFIIRIATPKYKTVKSNTVLSIRGGRSLTKYDEIRKLAELVGAEMAKRGDKTYVWSKLDTEHLANMVAGTMKYFASNVNVESLKFTTEALA